MEIKYKKILPDVEAPICATEGSAGTDLRACVNCEVILNPGETKIIPTGLAFEIPDGCFGMVCPRSGLAAKYGISILNSPGIIDSDYRGEVKVVLVNHSKTDFVVENGMRIAQLIIVPFQKAEWGEVAELSDTKRADGGFGSTGLH